MERTAGPEAAPILHVECPLCDAPASLDAAAGLLACDGCGISLELADDDPPAIPRAA